MIEGHSLRIAILAHSTNPRGGVVHALELGDALTRLGHRAVVHAPDAAGKGFFRATACETVSVPARPVTGGMGALVEARIADYIRHFETPAHRDFDVFHAQDGISGNALATLKESGLIRGFLRTVHHVDAFADARLSALQERSILAADGHFVVSRAWQRRLVKTRGLWADLVGNGVDLARFSPMADGNDAALRSRLDLAPGPVLLAIGGVEARKNTVRILEAFLQMRRIVPDAQLVIAGGASLLDHDAYRAEFDAVLAAAGADAAAVRLTGPLVDAEMVPLYRLADALVFASVKEGFGLCVLEAMASGLPVVVSDIEPFTEYLDRDGAVWCDPQRPGSIAEAMLLSLRPELRQRLVARGFEIARRHDWQRVAKLHLPLYERIAEPAHA